MLGWGATSINGAYIKDSVTGVSLHVVGGLVEVAYAGNVILPGDADHTSGMRDHNGSVPDDVTGVSLKDGRDDDQVAML